MAGLYWQVLNTELFEVYNLSTGAFVRAVTPAIDMLTATYGSETWTAGAVMPFALTFTSALTPAPTPTWHVWGRPFDSAVTIGSNGQVTTAYQDFGYTTANGGQITVPANCNGLYRHQGHPGAGRLAARHRLRILGATMWWRFAPSGAVGRHQRLYHRRRPHGGHRRDRQRQRDGDGHRHQLHHARLRPAIPFLSTGNTIRVEYYQ